MNAEEQAEGEKRVMKFLIEPLKLRGLAKPSTLKAAEFEDTLQSMCKKLAYMSEANLAALEEQVAANPGGKDRDRFPIANVILSWAADIQPPGDGASPLIRSVFAHEIGRTALEEGWAPELLHRLKRDRRWPSNWTLKGVKDGSGDAVRRLRNLDARLARGEELTPEEVEWRNRRVAALQRCRDIASVSQNAA